jgi:hypothetical protein
MCPEDPAPPMSDEERREMQQQTADLMAESARLLKEMQKLIDQAMRLQERDAQVRAQRERDEEKG